MKPIQTPQGFWVLEEDTHISKWARESGRLDHDQYLVPQITRWLKKGDYVIDCGAFIGDHTIAYKRAVGESGIVVAIEPNKQAFQCLMKNVPDAIHFNAFACQRSDDSAFIELDNKNCGATRISDPSSTDVGYIVNSVAIDHIVFGALGGKCEMIKMDVEGFEINALLGALKTLERCRPILVIEVNRGALQRNKCDYETVMAMLEQYRYNYDQIPAGKLTDPQYDLICLPKEYNAN